MARSTGYHRDARERAVHLLYEASQRGFDADRLFAEQVLEPDPLTLELVTGVLAEREELDALIERHAIGWEIGRMPTLDLIIMRVAAYELGHRDDTPTAVILNEAVDLANSYGGTDESGGYVNGVLAAVATALRG